VDFKTRTNSLLRHATQLKTIADKYKVVVVVINQVTDNVQGSTSSNISDLFYQPEDQYHIIGTPKLLPALGLIWSNCVNTRIALGRTKIMIEPESNLNQVGDDGGGTTAVSNSNSTKTILRTMQIVLSPYLPNSSCHFIIDGDGVRGYHIDIQ